MPITLAAKISNVPKFLTFVKDSLESYKVQDKNLAKSMLLCEEALVNLISHANKNTKITIEDPSKIFGTIKIPIKMPGEEFDFASSFNSPNSEISFDNSLYGEDTESYIRGIIFSSYKDNLSYKYKKGVNVVDIKLQLRSNPALLRTIYALVVAVIFGSACSFFAPQFINDGMVNFAFAPINNIYLNALKMIVGPVVFFSIASCIASCGNLRQFGKIGLKLVIIYFFTALLSMFFGGALSEVLNIGDPNLVNAISANSQDLINTAAESHVSLLDTIIGIVPSNFVKPFLESDMLALIFLGIIVGVALSKIKDQFPNIVKLFQACDKLFITITNMIIKLMPIVVFCSFTTICLTLETETIMSLLGWLITILAACFLMALFYLLYIPLRSRISSLPFAKRMIGLSINAMTLCSSSACMPISMDTCKKLGISSNVYSFAIPLGATVNMNGSAIYFTVTAFFMCSVFGVNLDAGTLFSLAVTILLLAVATPGVAGSNLVCMLIVFAQIGIPTEAIGLVIALNPLIDSFLTATNVFGDLASALIVSKDLKLFNKKKYYSKS